MDNKTLVHKQRLQNKGRMDKNKTSRDSLQRSKDSEKGTGKDSKSKIDNQTIIKRNLEEHFKQKGMLKSEDRKPRNAKTLFQLYQNALLEGWLPENIWIWKQGINRTEKEILRKEIIRRLN